MSGNLMLRRLRYSKIGVVVPEEEEEKCEGEGGGEEEGEGGGGGGEEEEEEEEAEREGEGEEEEVSGLLPRSEKSFALNNSNNNNNNMCSWFQMGHEIDRISVCVVARLRPRLLRNRGLIPVRATDFPPLLSDEIGCSQFIDRHI